MELLSRKIVDRIILIPAGEPLLRESAPVVDGLTRLEMCNLAKNDLPAHLKSLVEVSDIEVKRSGPSFAIDTVQEFSKKNDELFWIIGSDAYANIDKWHRADELKDLVNFIVIDRPSNDPSAQSDDTRVDAGIDIGALDISATKVRQDSEVHGVSPSVRAFITERKLYASK